MRKRLEALKKAYQEIGERSVRGENCIVWGCVEVSMVVKVRAYIV